MKQKFLWTSINKDVRNWARSCIQCQKSKISKHVQSPIGNYSLVSKRFSEIYLDIGGPLPPSEDKRFCVTILDRFSRWPEAVPVANIKAETVAEALLNRGMQFESELFIQLSKLIGFKRNRTMAYNPTSNGMLERWHRGLKAAIMAIGNQQWTKSLPLILLGLRTANWEDFQLTSAELVYGENLRLPGEFFNSSSDDNQCDTIAKLRNHFKLIKPSSPSRHNKNSVFVFKDLQNCLHVLVCTDAVKTALQAPYEGPFVVVGRFEKYFTILRKGEKSNFSINRLKPCFMIIPIY